MLSFAVLLLEFLTLRGQEKEGWGIATSKEKNLLFLGQMYRSEYFVFCRPGLRLFWETCNSTKTQTIHQILLILHFKNTRCTGFSRYPQMQDLENG